MKIEKLNNSDINKVVEIWYEVSLEAHDFVAPNLWKSKRAVMIEKYIPESETYVAKENNLISGFISMVDNYLAAIFVESNAQGKGVGKQLINHVKKSRAEIQLKVYKKNLRSIKFYISQGFKELSKEIDSDTGEVEILMEWKR